jgi:hypothetical protein
LLQRARRERRRGIAALFALIHARDGVSRFFQLGDDLERVVARFEVGVLPVDFDEPRPE